MLRGVQGARAPKWSVPPRQLDSTEYTPQSDPTCQLGIVAINFPVYKISLLLRGTGLGVRRRGTSPITILTELTASYKMRSLFSWHDRSRKKGKQKDDTTECIEAVGGGAKIGDARSGVTTLRLSI